MIVTKIQRLRGQRPRYSVHLDGKPELELSDWTLGKFGLRNGDDVDEETLGHIRSTETEIQAKNIAVNYISYRPRSSKEVIDHLLKKGIKRNCAQQVAKQLQSVKMIDDLKFAQVFVRDRLKRKPIGQALLRQQLLGKGIASSILDKVLDEQLTPQNQQASALIAAKRKLEMTQHSRKTIDADKRKKQILDFLLRRGFSYEIALKTIRATLDH